MNVKQLEKRVDVLNQRIHKRTDELSATRAEYKQLKSCLVEARREERRKA